MKKYITIICLLSFIARAEVVQLPAPVPVCGQITAIEVSGVIYNPEDNSWIINATPEISYPQPRNGGGVQASISLFVRLNIVVQRAEIETALGIADVGNATVDQLNETVRLIAMGKALAALSPEE
jgi:hypothetical protein